MRFRLNGKLGFLNLRNSSCNWRLKRNHLRAPSHREYDLTCCFTFRCVCNAVIWHSIFASIPYSWRQEEKPTSFSNHRAVNVTRGYVLFCHVFQHVVSTGAWCWAFFIYPDKALPATRMNLDHGQDSRPTFS